MGLGAPRELSQTYSKLLQDVKTYLDHVRRGQGEPLVQTDILVDIRVEDLEELQCGISDILNVMTKGRRDVTYFVYA
jgi:hypothetical protein